MSKYLIEVDEQMDRLLQNESKHRNTSIENLISQILNRYLVPMHTINQDEMAEGYEAMSEINLELANL